MNVEFIFPIRQLPLWMGAAGLALLLIAWTLRALEGRRSARIDNFVEAKLAPRLLMGFDATVRKPLFWLSLIGFAATALTLAQPHWGQAWQNITRRSHDIIICLDTSESMRAANPLPDRLTRAKQKIAALLDMAPADRFALVAFSGAAELQCPLTNDHGYFKAVLNAIDTDTISLEGTDIASALREAKDTFEGESERSGIFDRNSRAILLISDGESVSGDAIKAAEEAAEYARIYVIGVGDPRGAKVEFPAWMRRHVSAPNIDEPHLSKLDETNLQKIALTGNGGYKRSTPHNSDIEDVHNLIETLTTLEVSSDIRLRLVNRYQWPLALAIFCFAAEGFWRVVLPWARHRQMRQYNVAHGRKQSA